MAHSVIGRPTNDIGEYCKWLGEEDIISMADAIKYRSVPDFILFLFYLNTDCGHMSATKLFTIIYCSFNHEMRYPELNV